MSSPQGDTKQADTPLSVTPNQMPGQGNPPILPAIVNPDSRPTEFVDGQQVGKKTEDKPPAKQDAKPDAKPQDTKTDQPQGDSETVDMERFKAIQRIAREQEKRAKDNQSDAEAYRKLASLFGNGDGEAAQFDPQSEIQKLRDELSSERVERLREQVASSTGVPASLVSGSTEDDMRASATAAQDWAKGLAKSATGKPSVAPAESVTSTQAPHETGVKQIQSRNELKGMSSSEIMQAYADGRMDHLMGKSQ